MTGADFATLGLRVSATQGIQELDRYESSARRATQSTTLLEAGVQSLNNVYRLFGGAIAGISLARVTTETSNAQRAFAVLDATVRATGGAAGRTSLELVEMSASIQRISEFADDAAQGGLTRLLTYTSIAGDTFDRAAMAAVNMAAALRTDVTQAAEIVGRALEYPDHATQALIRQGFRFTQAQQEMIAEFVRTGEQAKAQAIILEELERVYNGVAEAARNTLGGALAGLGNAFGDLLEMSEQSSGGIVGAINSVTDALTALNESEEALDAIATAATAVAVIFASRWVAGFVAARAATIEMYAQVATGNAVLLNSGAAARQRAVFAEEAARAEAMAAERKLTLLRAEQVEIRAVMAAERERLALANARIARAVPEASLAPLGGAVAARDNAGVVFAYKQQADATKALTALQERQIALNAQIAATNGTVATTAATAAVAQSNLAAATSLSTRAMAALTPIARTMWAAIGGPIGATLIAMYAFYKLLIDVETAAQKQAAMLSRVKEETDRYAGSLSKLTAEQLANAAASERQNLARNQALLLAAQEAVVKAAANNTGMTRLSSDDQVSVDPLRLREVVQLQETINALSEEHLAIAGRLNALLGRRTELEKAGADATKKVQDANAERIRLAQQALELVGHEGESAAILAANHKATNDAIRARSELGGKDLADTLAAIEAERQLRIQVAQLTEAYAAAARQQSEFFRIAAAEARAFEEALDRINRRITEGIQARAGYLEHVGGIEAENKLLREQEAALLRSVAAFDAVILKQKQDAAVLQERIRLGDAFTDSDEQRIREAIARNEDLKRSVEELQQLWNRPPERNFDDVGAMAEGISRAASAAQGLLTIFGGVSREIAASVGQVAQLATNISRLQRSGIYRNEAGKEVNVGLGGALTGKAGVEGVANAWSSILGIVGATASVLQTLGGALESVINRGARARQQMAEFTRGLEDFAIVTRTALDEQLRQQQQAAMAQAQAAAKVSNWGGTASFSSPESMQFFINALRQGPEEARKYASALQQVHDQWKKNIEVLEQRNAAELSTLMDQYEASRLRMAGLDEEAEKILDQLATQKALDEAKRLGASASQLLTIETNLLAQAQQRAAEREKERRQEIENERRRIEDHYLAALSFTGSRRDFDDASLAAEQARRVWDAIQAGAGEAELAAIAFRNAAELAAHAAKRLEEDTRTREGFIAKGLGLLGDTRGQEDSDMFARQRQAWTDAIAEGMSPSNMALMAFTHFMEREQRAMQRAIEDQTRVVREAADAQIKAIDEQIDEIRKAAAEQIKALDAQIDETRKQAAATAKMYDDQIAAIQKRTTEERAIIDEQLKVARQSLDTEQNALRVAEQQMQATQRAFDALQTFERSLASGPQSLLSPTDRLAALRAEFEAMAAQAAGGDANAAGGLPAAAQALLQASQAVNASGDGFVTDFQRVRAVITDMTAKYGTQLSHEQRMVDSQRAAVEAIRDQIDVLEEQKEALLKASSDEIAALRELKEKASEDARLIIEQLQEQKDQVKTLAESQIDELIKTRDAIESEAQRQIEHIIRVENEAYLARIEAHEYYNTFRQHVDEQRQRDELFYGEMLRWIESPASLPDGQNPAANPVVTPNVTQPVPVTVDNREVVKQLESIVERQAEEIEHLTAAVLLLQEGFRTLQDESRETNVLLRENNRLTRRVEERLPS